LKVRKILRVSHGDVAAAVIRKSFDRHGQAIDARRLLDEDPLKVDLGGLPLAFYLIGGEASDSLSADFPASNAIASVPTATAASIV
jgi:hypothetical protein